MVAFCALPQQVNFVDKVPFRTFFASPTCAKRTDGPKGIVVALIESGLFVNKRYAVSKLYQIITKSHTQIITVSHTDYNKVSHTDLITKFFILLLFEVRFYSGALIIHA